MPKEHNIDHHELAAKYLSGNASDAEVQQLEGWVLAATENKKQFLALQRAWNLSNIKKDNDVLNLETEWNTISKQLENQTIEKGKVVKMPAKRSSFKWLGVAAALAALVAASIWLFNSNNNTTTNPNALVLSSENDIKEEQLKDGTQVDLNQYATISYEDAMNGDRLVTLSGDAFFKVVRDEERPFIIKAQEVAVQVLGTSFYVDARDGVDEVQVIVASGVVAMKVGDQRLILKKGEIGTYIKSTQQLTQRQNDDDNYMAWKTKKLTYENALLGKVVSDLNRTFHADISLENAGLQNCPLTATYEDQTLEAITRILEKTLNLKATTNGERIVLSGSPCE